MRRTDYFPMNYKDENGNWIGFDTEFAKAVANELDLEVEFVLIDWSAKYEKLNSGEIDLIWNGYTYSNESDGTPRTELVDFSHSYLVNSQVIVVKTDQYYEFNSSVDFQGLTAAVEGGSSGVSVARDLTTGNGYIYEFATQADALTDLYLNNSDFAVVDRKLAEGVIGHGDYADLAIIDAVTFEPEIYAIGARKNSDFVDVLNNAIEKLSADGTLTRLAEKYGLEKDLIEKIGSSTIKTVNINLTDEKYAIAVDKNQPELLADINRFITKIKYDGTLDKLLNGHFAGGKFTAVYSAERNEYRDQLVVATNATFAPFEWCSGDAYYGVDMEIASLLADYLGKELVIENMDFEAVLTSVQNGTCDIGIASLMATPGRMDFVDFSIPYYNASLNIITKSDDSTFDNCRTAFDAERILNSFDYDTKIGTQTDTTAMSYVRGDDTLGFPGFDVNGLVYDNCRLAVTDLLNDNIDFVITDNSVAIFLEK